MSFNIIVVCSLMIHISKMVQKPISESDLSDRVHNRVPFKGSRPSFIHVVTIMTLEMLKIDLMVQKPKAIF